MKKFRIGSGLQNFHIRTLLAYFDFAPCLSEMDKDLALDLI